MKEMGGKDSTPTSLQIYNGDNSLLFDGGKVLAISHQQFVKFGNAITFSNPFPKMNA
jgi:hypothetical protein